MDASRFKRRETQTQRHINMEGYAVPRPQRPVTARRPPLDASLTPSQTQQIPLPQPTHPVATPAVRPVDFQAPQTAASMRHRSIDHQPVLAPKPVSIEEPEQQPLERTPAFDMGLPGEASSFRLADAIKKGKAGFKVWALRSTVAMVVIILATGGILFSQGLLKVHKVFKGNSATAAALKANVNPDLLKGEGDGRVNVLLLGRGGGNHDAPDLTDTLMLASIDPVNKTSTLLSIPRDLWVDVPNNGAMKLNAVWETGKYKHLGKMSSDMSNSQAVQAGFTMIDQTVEDITGVPIHYNALVDFKAFQQAVDTVGGVTVNVPEDLYDPTMAWENNRNPILAKAGTQTFDGKHALIYARSRETSSDFARSQRQRSVLLGLKSKVDTLGTISNPLKLSKLMSAFGNNAQTDLSINDASRLYTITKAIQQTAVTSIGFADPPNSFVTTGNMNGQSIVLPRAGLFQYKNIQNYVRSQLKDGYIAKEGAKVLVLNGTTVPGLATTTADKLKTYGYNVVGTGNTPSTGWTETTLVDYTKGKKKYTKHYLEQRFNTSAKSSLNDTTIQTNGADFVIIIGSNESTGT